MTKISALPTKSSIASSDLIPIVDQSTSTTKKVTQATLAASMATTASGWASLASGLTYAANNGNKEFTCTASGVDLTQTLSPGMKLQVTRSTTPPTQCMAFTSASSQYATKSSPTGITFTAAFTCEAWIYLNSYTGQRQYIVSRTDASTGGWYFRVEGDGRLTIGYGTSSNFTEWNTYQAMPLSRWIHVAGVVSSTTSKTLQGIYLNGVSIPTSQNLSAAANLTQVTSNLSVGAVNAGGANSFMNGYASEVRVWSAAQTGANIQANMTINCVGTETNLVGCWRGNASFADQTTNANTLTANGGAIATQASNPYNAVEYFIITNVTYSNPTSTVTLFGGTANQLPNQALNSPQYSSAREPYGFPAARNNWIVDFIALIAQSQSSPAANTWYNIGQAQLSIPTGPWRISYSGFGVPSAAASGVGMWATLSTANNSATDLTTTSRIYSSTTSTIGGLLSKEVFYTLASQTIYYVNVQSDLTTPGTLTWLSGNSSTALIIRAECGYA